MHGVLQSTSRRKLKHIRQRMRGPGNTEKCGFTLLKQARQLSTQKKASETTQLGREGKTTEKKNNVSL